MQFTIKDIQDMASDVTFDRGLRYYRSGQARITEYAPGQSSFYAEVQGSGTRPYRVIVSMGHFLSGDCSCPVGFDCKHAVAAALQWLADNDMAAQRDRGRQPDALQRWLSELPDSGTARTDTLTYGRHHVLYELRVSGQQVRLHLKKAYLKKNGKWSQLTYFTPDYYSLRWNRPAHVTEEDVAILQLLPRYHELSGCELDGEAARLALEHMLHTGRLICAGQVVTRGPAHTLQWQWDTDARGHYQLRAGLAELAYVDSDASWLPITTTPPFYLNLAQSQLGDLITPVAPHQLTHLMDMPPVPSDEMPTIAAKLRRVLNADQLPVPVELPQAVEANEPLPCLTLEPVSLFGNPSLPAALVHFEYAGQQQAPRYDPASRLHDEPQQIGDQLVQINRDMAQEDQYLAQLREVGLKLHSQVNDHAFAWLPEPRQVPGLIAFWEDFLARQIPALEQRGWRVQFDDSVHPNISNVEFEFDISDESSHWFELGLSLPLSDGRELNTTDVVAQWLKQGSPDELIIPDEGEWLRIDTRALNTVQDLITELYNRKQLNKPARLAAFQIAQLQDIPDLNYRAAPMTQQLLQQLRDFNGIEAVPLSPQMQATLRPYQQDGLNWLAFLHRYHLGGILADDMGLGKTLQALALLQHIKDQGQLDTPALILAPTSLTGNWMHEAARFAPHLKVTLIHGPDRASAFAHIARSDVVITTYPLLPRDIEHYKDIHFSVLILDEAQAIKNPTTKISVQARRVNARTRLCLTGTPLENHLGELWSLMDFALPGLLAGRKTFQQQFRTPIEKHADAEQQKLLARRVAPFMLRRRKSEVVKELPPKTEIVQYVELAGKQRALYESIRVSMEKRIRDLVAQQGMQRSHIQFLDALLKLRQACIDPRLVKLEKAAAIREHAKMDWLTDNLPQLLEEGRRVLIFSQFTELLALIEQELTALDISYCKLTGQTRKRQEQIDRFQRGEASVFLISLKAGGSGLNLTTADVVIHMDPWWNPAVENQATDRAHRIGQDKPVFVYKLVAADTVEERIQQMQQKKQTLADRLFDDAVASSVPLDQDALLSLLSGKNGDGGNT